MITGKLGYFKTMWKWLTQQEWEVIEEQLQYEQGNNPVNNEFLWNNSLLILEFRTIEQVAEEATAYMIIDENI